MTPTSPIKRPVQIELGCGEFKHEGSVGLDRRITPVVDVVGEVARLPFRSSVATTIWAESLLEHCPDPYPVLDEIHRVLREDGTAVCVLPNLGTYSAHLDTTHVFLADLALWRQILSGYFERVHVRPVGTKYRDNSFLTFVNKVLVRILRFYELAQGWEVTLTSKRVRPERRYRPWWSEGTRTR